MKEYRISLVCFFTLSLLIILPVIVRAETIFITGPITDDTVWSPPNVYVIDRSFSIPTGVTLTIKPGTIIKGKNSGSLGSGIHGKLEARGTSVLPIYFTSWSDDSVGGDTNLDGPSTAINSSWQGLYFKQGSVGQFDFVDLGYAGAGRLVGIENDGGNVEIRNSNIHDNYSNLFDWVIGHYRSGNNILQKSGNLLVASSTIDNSSNGISIESGQADISGNIFKNHNGYGGGFGIYVNGGQSLILFNNTFENNQRTASISASTVFSHGGNTSSDFSNRGFEINGSLSGNTTFLGGDLPYIVGNITVGLGQTLTLKPGVILKMSDRFSNGAITIKGKLIAHGTPEAKIYITSLRDDSIGGDTNGDGTVTLPAPRNWNAIFLEGGSIADFKETIVRYGGYNYNGEYLTGVAAAIYQRGAVFSITNSIFEYNAGASIFQDGGSTEVMSSEFRNGDTGLWSRGGNAKISRSSFENNFGIGIYNQGGPTIDARQNWWGDPSGPRDTSTTTPTGLGDRINGDILYHPFLTTPPQPLAKCCSNVLFLPGIKGSVLKSGSDTIWPPTVFSNDVLQLALNENGESINQVKVDGILNKFYSANIYQDFSDFMDNLKTINPTTGTSTIKNWLPLGYDWRYSPAKIVRDGIETQNGHLNVIETIEHLAADSPTGQVTIVAHSMGGLLGKAIVKELESQNRTDLIDSFVMVGSPQLGTPQALASLLHGDGENILGGVITAKSEIRNIARNMQSAYDLLPSPRYFVQVLDPIATFKEADFTMSWRNLWGDNINNFAELQAFASGAGRSRPSQSDLFTPEVLRLDLLEQAQNFHDQYDNYELPANIRVVQIAGWGLPTTKTIEYKKRHNQPYYSASFTVEGDKTVVYQSAISSNKTETYYLNLSTYNNDQSKSFQHRDVLSTDPIKEVTYKIIKNEVIENISYISNTKPPLTEEDTKLLVSTHSPVILGAYDANGKFTGVVQNQNPSSGMLEIKEEIPGSSFFSIGESQYVFLPKSGSYDFVFKGTGTGPATVEIGDFANDQETLLATFTDLPVTPNTEASFTVTSTAPDQTVILIDEDHDGNPDLTVRPDGSTLSLPELLNILKSNISALEAKNSLKQKLLKKIDKLEKRIGKQKLNLANKTLDQISRKINKKVADSKISETEANEILEILDQMESLL